MLEEMELYKDTSTEKYLIDDDTTLIKKYTIHQPKRFVLYNLAENTIISPLHYP